jgi:colanic acid/amylovoran biosynthesis glycosyltransferase
MCKASDASNGVSIAHFINPFLPITQNWIYHQLCFNAEFRHIVLCQTIENRELFPWKTAYPAFKKKTFIAAIGLFLARARAQYFPGHYLRVIKREKPRIFHGHFSWESWRNFGLIKKSGLPLVTTFYGLDVNKLAKLPQWQRRYKALFQRGEIFTVEGPFMAKALAAIGCPEDKIRIVPIGVDIERIHGLAIPKTGPMIKIMFVGLEREKKGSLFAAAAFARVATNHKNIELHLIGSGGYYNPVHKILEQAGVLDRCFFHGYISFDIYCNLLGQMDIVLAPSVTARNGDTEGGAPVVIIEAQAAGIPVVATIHCDIPNIVIHEKTGLLCDERDEGALTKNLERMVFNSELREKFGIAAASHAGINFSIQGQVKKLNEIYRSLI